MSVERIAEALLAIRKNVLSAHGSFQQTTRAESIARAQAEAIHGALETYCDPDDERGAIRFLEDCANPESAE